MPVVAMPVVAMHVPAKRSPGMRHARAWILSTVAASLCALAWGLPVQASDALSPDAMSPGGAGPGPAGRRPPPPGPPRAADLQRDLGISEAQAKAVAATLAAHHAQMRQLEDGARDQRQALRARTDAQLKTTLGDAGFQRFQAWRAEHRPPPRGRPPGGREGGAGGRPDGGPGEGPRDGRRPPRDPSMPPPPLPPPAED